MSDNSSPDEKDTMTKYNIKGELHTEHVEPNQGQRSASFGGRNLSIATDGGRQYSTGGARRMSEWDAMKIAKEGGVEIDEEIELLEEVLRQNPVQTSFFSPVINFKDPKHFTSDLPR